MFRALKNLQKLSSLGHFLKGSSAALGLTKVQLSCEHIQHYGEMKEVRDGAMVAIPEADAIVKITKSLARAREEYADAKKWLDQFYVDYKGPSRIQY
jgi:HPt (histidine-containing phosphotransfer) domain-containing protein